MNFECPAHNKPIVLTCLNAACQRPRPVCQKCIVLHKEHSVDLYDLDDIQNQSEIRKQSLQQIKDKVLESLEDISNNYVPLPSTIECFKLETDLLQNISHANWDEFNGSLETLAQRRTFEPIRKGRKQHKRTKFYQKLFVGLIILFSIFFVTGEENETEIELQHQINELKFQLLKYETNVLQMSSSNQTTEIFKFYQQQRQCSVILKPKVNVTLIQFEIGSLFYSPYGWNHQIYHPDLRIEIFADQKFNHTERITLNHNENLNPSGLYSFDFDHKIPLVEGVSYKFSFQIEGKQEIWFNGYEQDPKKNQYIEITNTCPILKSIKFH